MAKIKIAEAIRIINERKKAKNVAAKKEKSKVRLAIRYQKQKEALKQKRAESQLTHSKGVNRRQCRVCKPY